MDNMFTLIRNCKT